MLLFTPGFTFKGKPAAFIVRGSAVGTVLKAVELGKRAALGWRKAAWSAAAGVKP